MDVTRCSNDCLSCLETDPWSKKPRPGALVCCVWLFVCVCMWACSHAWWHTNRHQRWLYARLLLRRSSLITSLLPLYLSFSFSCLPLTPPFTYSSCSPFPFATVWPVYHPALTAWEHFHQDLNPKHEDYAKWNSWTALNKSCEMTKIMKIEANSFVPCLILLINSYTAYISLHLFLYLSIFSNAWFVMEECVLRVDRDIRSPGRVTLYLLLKLGNHWEVHLLP